MAIDIPTTWVKLFVEGELVSDEFPFPDSPNGMGQVKPEPGIEFQSQGSSAVYRVERVEPNPDFPGRFIVHAKRIG